ncbi:cytochrome c551 [Aneurinibacillus soli]|uniref:Cytochrome c-551 n=1 Tax=Aneurinibacillus soli TaxID=1500254 RepID=A0A0U5B4J3_9BACL|nr:cytochrome c [Aneurinibacillus soli]PYE61463.1 cytochrome c551 [Aneurinibacillus soli]BAU26582.1 Cytochrome c-551 precursor [Aneurinibacillus soli]
MKKSMMIASFLLVIALAVGCGVAKSDNPGNKPAAQAPAGNTSGGAAGKTGGSATDGVHAEAQKMYQAKCTACHGQDMKGGAGPALMQVGSRYKSADEIKTILMKGKDGMPGGLVSEEEAKKLSDWLMTMK